MLRSADQNDLEESEKFEDPDWWLQVVRESDVDAFQEAIFRKASGLCWQDKLGRTLLHIAAANDQTEIIKVLASLKFDLNAQDQRGMTALQEAVHFDKPNAIHALILAGANVTLLSNVGLSALFYAVDLNHVASLRALLTYDTLVDINSKDSSGSTALHHAAAKNRLECANILLEKNADYKLKNNAGLRPSNVAGYAAAADVLRALAVQVKKDKLDIKTLANTYDAEGNLVLHAAVDTGSLETVQVCLEIGADIDCQQQDQSTPVHFAAMRGELQIVKTMLSAQPERVANVLRLKDKNGMTVLHMAMLFDNVQIAEFLISQGANIESADINEQTPLLLACSKKSIRCAKLLLTHGADARRIDKKGRNFIHYAILSGLRLDELVKEESVELLQDLLNRKDHFGFGPLHYASVEGHLFATEDLLSFGAGLDFRTDQKRTALHLAARFGRFNTCEKMLDSLQGDRIINATDGEGWTALHFSARYGHTKVCRLLLKRGANLHRASCGNSPFNMATLGGHIKVMRLLLNVNHHLLNLQCKTGNTALHLASLHGHAKATEFLLNEGAEIKLNTDGCTFFDLAIKDRKTEVCETAMKHSRWREILSTNSQLYPSPIFGLIEELPDVCMLVLDRCVTTDNESSSNKARAITYDFTFLELERPKERSTTYEAVTLDWNDLKKDATYDDSAAAIAVNAPSGVSSKQQFATPKKEDPFKALRKSGLPVAKHMLKHHRVDLLLSPLCTEYLKMKWQRVAKWLTVWYLTWQVLITLGMAVIVWLSPPLIHCYLLVESDCDAWRNQSCVSEFMQRPMCTVPNSYKACIIGTVALLLSEIPIYVFIVSSATMELMLDDDSITMLIATVSQLGFAIPTMYTEGMMVNSAFQWCMLAISIVSNCCLLLLYLRINDRFGTFLVMFSEVLKTILTCYGTFIFLIFGFALAFTVLFQIPIENSHDYEEFLGAMAHENPWISLLRCFVMTTGELKMTVTMLGALTDPAKSRGAPFPVTTPLIFIAFTILISIALFNLTVGLAIGDAKKIHRNAELRRLAASIEFYAVMEGRRKNLSALSHYRPESVILYPDAKVSGFSRFLLFDYSTIRQKADRHATECATRQRFQHSVGHWMNKHKRRTKEITVLLESNAELTKLALQKLGNDRNDLLLRDDEREDVDYLNQLQSIKSKATADWLPLYFNVTSRQESSIGRSRLSSGAAMDGEISNSVSTGRGRASSTNVQTGRLLPNLGRAKVDPTDQSGSNK